MKMKITIITMKVEEQGLGFHPDWCFLAQGWLISQRGVLDVWCIFNCQLVVVFFFLENWVHIKFTYEVRQGIAFLPIVAETFGGWHSDTKREVKLGAALARHTGQDEGEATSHLWSRMSILLQRGNAAILGNRIPNQPGAYIDGIIWSINPLPLTDDHCVREPEIYIYTTFWLFCCEFMHFLVYFYRAK